MVVLAALVGAARGVWVRVLGVVRAMLCCEGVRLGRRLRPYARRAISGVGLTMGRYLPILSVCLGEKLELCSRSSFRF